MNIHKPWLPATAALLILSACGGGGGGGSASNADPVTTEPVTPPVTQPVAPVTPVTPPVSTGSDRIEPFDTAATVTASSTAAKDAAVKTQAQGVAPASAVRRVALGALAQSATTKAASTKAVAPGEARQIGVARGVADTSTVAATQALLQWRATDRGTQVAALAFDSAGAYGVRLGVLVRGLPDGAVLRFYGADAAAAVQVSAQELAAIAARNAQGGANDTTARTYWSPDFAGPATTLEVEIPAAAATAAVQLAVPRLSHFTVAPEAVEGAFTTKVGESESCNIDVTCRPEFSSESRSVARMVFVRDDGKSYLCTGTLLNDARSSTTPYFLSANHCFSTQAVASTLTTDWFYRSSACNTSNINPGTVRLTGGATLLHATATTDTAFMRLNNPAPAGVVYAGSYFGGVAVATAVTGIHHPSGDLQKVSQGTVQRYSICTTSTCQSSTSDNGTFLTTTWQQGTTEGGSSGSALFVGIGSRRYVVGQLLGGTASCSAPGNPDQYGRFDQPYRSTLRQWLNPGT
ncbi:MULTISPECIES: endoproteinase ArgC [unclassified Acidovorax]|uniref:trypsin-like serine peptidase n=1 Tax=unclassified Acidovorax TaxID=2684926 RepID=UPI002882D7B3|nr:MULTISPECIES: endoproteinase ArgC [unclassified Acidovorax]